ncbi:MAG: hypothetical protein R3E39_12105 [Anaerolineae bacterium]
MNETFIETLRSWQNFYFMIGGASAGLMGLMFVALSLGTHLVNDQTASNVAAFVTPSIIYFVSVLLVAGVMLVPTFTTLVLGIVLAAGGAVGLVRTTGHVRDLIRVNNEYQDFSRWDWLWQVILPLVSYGLLVLAGLGFLFDQWTVAFMGVWLAVLMLLLCAIANTWSLVLWIVEQGGS